MGRPKLPQTKEQIAIRLAPGTKARLSALIRAMQAKGIDVPMRSEVLRQAIERGIEAMEGDLVAPARPPREVPREPVAPAAPAPARPRAVPPPPHMPVPASVRSTQPVRSEAAPARAAVAQTPRPAERERPAPPPPPAAPPAKRPAPSPAPVAAPAGTRRGPIPGTLADRTLRALREKGPSSVPALCRAVWPHNPPRVHEALSELRNLGLIELIAATSSELNGSDRELILIDPSGASFGSARLR